MHLSLSTLAVVALGASQAAALGINCRGSSNCAGGINAMGNIAKSMDDAIAAGHGGRHYNNGRKLPSRHNLSVCVCGTNGSFRTNGLLDEHRGGPGVCVLAVRRRQRDDAGGARLRHGAAES